MPQLRTEPYAVLVADMVGYSQRLAQHPVDTHTAFRGHLHDVFEPTVGDHRGRVVKTTGDGIVAVFADAGQAESCGREIQLQLQRQADREPSFAPIKYRIAAHYGSIVVESRDIFGLDVNIAIHMQALAPAGGVCVSGALFDLLSEQSRERYRYLGKKYLKNIPTPVTVHTYDPAPASPRRLSEDRSQAARRSYLSAPPGLAVAEFQVVAGSPAQQVLANIAQDSLTSGLSRFGDLLTIAPIGATIRQIAAERAKSREFLSNEMACEYLLHGSCVIGPATLELMAHLESLVNREVLWSGKVSVALDQGLESIDKAIAAELVAPVVLYLERSEVTSLGVTGQSENERHFRQAKRLMEVRTLASLEEARHLLSEIIGRCGEVGDVFIALARAEHSYGHLLAGQQFVDSLERAREYAKKAIEVDDLNPSAHAELALQELFLKRQSSAAEIYRHALRLNPYDPMLRADWGDCLANMGQAQEAVSILEDVLSGWPRDRLWVEWNLCDAYWALGRPDRIISLLDRHPVQPYVHRNLAASYAKLGKMDEARRHAEMVRSHQPGFSAKLWRQVMPNVNSDQSDEFVAFLERAGL